MGIARQTSDISPQWRCRYVLLLSLGLQPSAGWDFISNISFTLLSMSHLQQESQDKGDEIRCCLYQMGTNATTQNAKCRLTVSSRVDITGVLLSPGRVRLWANFLPQRAMRGAEPAVGSEVGMVWRSTSFLDARKSKLYQLYEHRKILK